MYKKHTVLALVPARSGSKQMRHKNIASLGGRPVLGHTAATATGSRIVDRAVLSTDSKKYAAIGSRYRLEVPFMRPADISSDSALAIDVMLHALEHYKNVEGFVPDVLLYLQPTSPFRTSKDIDTALKLLIDDPRASGVVSVTEVPHRFMPEKLMHQQGKYVMPNTGATLNRDALKNKKLFARNGPSILAVRTKFLLKHKKFYDQHTLPYVMKGVCAAVDIDTPDDLVEARMLWPLWNNSK